MQMEEKFALVLPVPGGRSALAPQKTKTAGRKVLTHSPVLQPTAQNSRLENVAWAVLAGSGIATLVLCLS